MDINSGIYLSYVYVEMSYYRDLLWKGML